MPTIEWPPGKFGPHTSEYGVGIARCLAGVRGIEASQDAAFLGIGDGVVLTGRLGAETTLCVWALANLWSSRPVLGGGEVWAPAAPTEWVPDWGWPPGGLGAETTKIGWVPLPCWSSRPVCGVEDMSILNRCFDQPRHSVTNKTPASVIQRPPNRDIVQPLNIATPSR